MELVHLQTLSNNCLCVAIGNIMQFLEWEQAMWAWIFWGRPQREIGLGLGFNEWNGGEKH